MENCIFCRIIAGEIPSMRIYEDQDCIATLDIGPAAKGHTLIILGKLMKVAASVGMRQKERLSAAGFNIVQNNGEAAGQTVPHLHIHVIPRYEGGPVMVAWEPTDPGMDALQEVYEILKD